MTGDRYTSYRLASKDKSAQKGSRSGSKKNSTKKMSELSDIEDTLRRLEISNGTVSSCNCNGRKHPLNTITPNCLNCGKIICAKNSTSVCSSCGAKLLSNDELDAIRTVLEMEREDITSHGSNGKKGKGTMNALDEANSRLTRLLGYQESSAVRTHIIDQASDFDLPGSGPNKWATATEQAEQLKKQFRMLKQQKKRNDKHQGRGSNVLSIDLKGNKVVMNTSKGYDFDSSSEDETVLAVTEPATSMHNSSIDNASEGPKEEKKLISPQYNKKSSLAKDKVSVQPSRLQEHGEDEYLEL